MANNGRINDVVFMRHFVLLTAQSEMLHLRWANELLWELFDSGDDSPL